ncbi:MAG: SDR family oxidoreductase, partial [Verrucomicrobia bacterium]|nr:SDR family oxidoreductase [Cytophagales bacterium]
MTDFSGKNILVVGGSSGIGLALVKKLKTNGATVISASRHQGDLPEGVQHISIDVTQDISALAGVLPEALHGVAYCPGTINLKPFARLTEEDFLNDFKINVLGAVKVLQTALLKLKNAENASIVLFSTVAVQTGLSFHASIATAKGGIEGLAVSLAAELAPNKIRVNAIAPSLTETPLAGNLLSTPEKKEASNKRHPLGRYGTAEELAGVANFLLSDDSSWMTGQVLHI